MEDEDVNGCHKIGRGPSRERAHQQQAVHHVPEEEGLLGLAELADGHVRQQLALQDLPRVLDAPLLRHARHAAALADVVQRHLDSVKGSRNAQPARAATVGNAWPACAAGACRVAGWMSGSIEIRMNTTSMLVHLNQCQAFLHTRLCAQRHNLSKEPKEVGYLHEKTQMQGAALPNLTWREPIPRKGAEACRSPARALFHCQPRQGASPAHLLALDGEGLLDAGPQRLHHLGVAEVVHDVLQDVAVRRQAQRAEDDQYWQVGADVGYRRADGLVATSGPCTPVKSRGWPYHEKQAMYTSQQPARMQCCTWTPQMS